MKQASRFASYRLAVIRSNSLPGFIFEAQPFTRQDALVDIEISDSLEAERDGQLASASYRLETSAWSFLVAIKDALLLSDQIFLQHILTLIASCTHSHTHIHTHTHTYTIYLSL